MAFVFIGKGIRALQEGNVIGITVRKGMPSVPSLGIFPSMETLTAQAVLLVLFVFMVVKSFMPERSSASAST
jgi:high-affinity iron transporter